LVAAKILLVTRKILLVAMPRRDQWKKNGSSVKWSDVTQMSVKTSFLNSRVHAKHVPGWDVPLFFDV
jgi:hypothetical protein